MDDLRQVYRDRLGARAEALEATWRAMASTPAEAIPAMRRLAHAMRGSGGTFGFPEISEAAKAVEEAPDDGVASAALGLLDVVRRVVSENQPSLLRILVIEDDPVAGEIARAVLTAPGHEVVVTATAATARAALAGGDFALIVMDLMLPDEDGRRVLSSLRRDPRTAAVPVIVATGKLGGAVQAECFTLGADSYLEKPLDPHVLAAAAASFLERRRLAPGIPVPAAAHEPVREAAPAPAPAPVPAPAGRRVLLAEDDELIAAVVRHRFEREGFAVDHLPDGLEALRRGMSGAGGYALGVFDVKMPGLDGFGLLERLRGQAAWRDTPIIMLTSLGAEKDVVRAFSLGASDYVVKPFSPAELLARARRLCG